jgi:hypothetical protein
MGLVSSLPMKFVQHPMKHGHQQHPAAHYQKNSTINSIKARKNLAPIGVQGIHRPHAAQQHGCVYKRINPRHFFKMVVAPRAIALGILFL